MIPILVILAWVACGVIAYGATLADFRGEFPASAARDRSLGRGIAALMGAFGPFGLIVASIMTDGFRHGLMFRVRP